MSQQKEASHCGQLPFHSLGQSSPTQARIAHLAREGKLHVLPSQNYSGQSAGQYNGRNYLVSYIIHFIMFN